MTDTTEWTPEARKIREAERAAARAAYSSGLYVGIRALSVDQYVDEKYPAPPPEYTYGREVFDPAVGLMYCRRSDGEWTCGGCDTSARTDAVVRALAAEVPLTDAECDALTLAYWSTHVERRAFVRTAFARVMRGEVK